MIPVSKICFLAPMTGRNFGRVTVQTEILTDLFRRQGFPVIAESSSLFRLKRLLDFSLTLLLRSREIKVVHLSCFSGRSFIVEDVSSAIAVMRKLPLIMHLHGGNFPAFISRFPRWSKRVFERADQIVAPSAYLAKAVEQLGFKVKIIPNVLDLNEYPFTLKKTAAPRLLWMRTFHEIYNPIMALRVLAFLKKKYPESSLVMAGEEKGMLGQCRKFACKNGLESSVEFAGFLSAERKREYTKKCDVFINTNNIDNAPVSVLEACAFGLPVITTRVGGLADMVTDYETALLVEPDDDGAMTAKVCEVIENPALCLKLSQAGRALAEKSSWERVFPQWMEVFTQAEKK